MISVALMASPPLALARRIDPAPLVGRWVSPADVDKCNAYRAVCQAFFAKKFSGQGAKRWSCKKKISRGVAAPEPGCGLLYYYDRGRAHGKGIYIIYVFT